MTNDKKRKMSINIAPSSPAKRRRTTPTKKSATESKRVKLPSKSQDKKSNDRSEESLDKPSLDIEDGEIVNSKKTAEKPVVSKKRKLDDDDISAKAASPYAKKQKTTTKVSTPKKTAEKVTKPNTPEKAATSRNVGNTTSATKKKVAAPKEGIKKSNIAASKEGTKKDLAAPKQDTKKATKPTAPISEPEPQKTPKLTERQLLNRKEYAAAQEAKRCLPQKYKNNKLLREEIGDFCTTKGIGNFETMMSSENQARLVKEFVKRAQLTALLAAQKRAVKDKDQEKTHWDKKGQHNNHSAKLIHDDKLSSLQRDVDYADKALKEWEAHDGNIFYRRAYEATLTGKGSKKKYTVKDLRDRKWEGRQSAFFSARLPVEIWEQRVTDDDARAARSAESQVLPPQQPSEDRRPKTKSGKKTPAASKSGGITKGSDAGAADPEPNSGDSPFWAVNAEQALRMCHFLSKKIGHVRVETCEAEDSDDGEEQTVAIAYDLRGNVIIPDEGDEDNFYHANCNYMLRKLEYLAQVPMGFLKGAEVAVVDCFLKNDKLEEVRSKIAKSFDVNWKVESDDFVVEAINKLYDIEFPEGFLNAMMRESNRQKKAPNGKVKLTGPKS